MALSRPAVNVRWSCWLCFQLFRPLWFALWLSLESTPTIPSGLADLWSQIHRLNSIRHNHHPGNSTPLSFNRGEGWRSARWPPGVEEYRNSCSYNPSTNQTGPMPPRAFRGNPANITRSYKRACTRAGLHGHTSYKGKLMTCQQLHYTPPTVESIEHLFMEPIGLGTASADRASCGYRHNQYMWWCYKKPDGTRAGREGKENGI